VPPSVEPDVGVTDWIVGTVDGGGVGVVGELSGHADDRKPRRADAIAKATRLWHVSLRPGYGLPVCTIADPPGQYAITP
jgi:hypothetical protein